MSTTQEVPHTDATRQWWLGEDGNVKGPYAAPFVVIAIKTGKLRANALACLVGTQEWRALAEWPDFKPVLGPTPPPLPSSHEVRLAVAYAGFWDRVRAIVLDGVVLFWGLNWWALFWRRSSESSGRTKQPMRCSC